MAANYVNLSDSLGEWRIKANEVYGKVGNLTDLTKNATVEYTGLVGQNQNDFTGNYATFTIRRVAGSYEVDIDTAGSGYEVGDTIVIDGAILGGTSGINDATITITAVDPGFAATAATVSGVAVADLISEVNALRTELGSLLNFSLNTDNDTFYEAVNEIEQVLRNGGLASYALNTDAQDVVAALNEIETALRGANATYGLDTDSNDVVSAINEFQAEIGRVEDFTPQGTSSDPRVEYVDLGATVLSAVNSLKGKADLIADELGGIMAVDFDGPDQNIMDALNTLYNRSDLGTLDQVYVRRNGADVMTGMLQLSQFGITSNENNLLLKTGAADVTAVTINASNQNVGIGGAAGTHKVRVTGAVNATTGFYYNGDDTDTRYIRADVGSAQNLDIDTTVRANINLAPAVGKAVTIGGSVVTNDSYTFLEWAQDQVGAMFTGNLEERGISATYDDTTGKIDLAIANNSHNHLSTNISDFTEAVQDTVGNMFTGNTENGISLDYNDTTGKINVDVNDPVITISGEASGSATMTNLGNTNIAVTLNTEAIQDRMSSLFTSGAHTGISAVYDDANNRINLALTSDITLNLTGDASGSIQFVDLAQGSYNLAVTVADDSHFHNSGTISDFTEAVQDVVGGMVNPTNIEAGINVYYDDNTGKLNFDVNDPTITLSGGVSGSATMSNLGSININTTVTNDSHTHDGRYYTEAEADARFINATGDTMTGQLVLAAGAGGGIKFPDNAYGGTGDTASVTLETSSGEATKMRFKMTNDSDDQFEFTAPSNEGMKMNGHSILHDGNYSSRTIYRTQFYNQQSLTIYNSGGGALKTIYGAGG